MSASCIVLGVHLSVAIATENFSLIHNLECGTYVLIKMLAHCIHHICVHKL